MWRNAQRDEQGAIAARYQETASFLRDELAEISLICIVDDQEAPAPSESILNNLPGRQTAATFRLDWLTNPVGENLRYRLCTIVSSPVHGEYSVWKPIAIPPGEPRRQRRLAKAGAAPNAGDPVATLVDKRVAETEERAAASNEGPHIYHRWAERDGRGPRNRRGRTLASEAQEKRLQLFVFGSIADRKNPFVSRVLAFERLDLALKAEPEMPVSRR